MIFIHLSCLERRFIFLKNLVTSFNGTALNTCLGCSFVFNSTQGLANQNRTHKNIMDAREQRRYLQSALLGRLAVEEMRFVSQQDEDGILELQTEDNELDTFSFRILILKLRHTLRLFIMISFSNQRSFLESINTYILSEELRFNNTDLDLLELQGSQVLE